MEYLKAVWEYSIVYSTPPVNIVVFAVLHCEIFYIRV